MPSSYLSDLRSAWKERIVDWRLRGEQWKMQIRRPFRTWNLPVIFMGFLLGRAMILDAIAPFAVAYLAVVFHLCRRQWPLAFLSLILGGLTLNEIHAVQIAGFLMLFLLVQKAFDWMGKGQLNYVPFVVLIAGVGGHLGKIGWEGWSPYQGIMAGVEILLSFILTFIFVQSLPIFTVRRKRYALRHEEMICLIILAGSVITGTIGWTLSGMELVKVVSRYLIMVMALAGGGMLGASVGVVMGMIMSLSEPRSIAQVSLLAFSGLLAGLFREGKRWGVAIGFLLGTSIFALYGTSSEQVWASLRESVVALLLFLVTPESFFRAVARYIPGTVEHESSRQEYIRRLRDVTAAKVEQFAELFSELSRSFREADRRHRREEEAQLNYFLSEVMEGSCKMCRRYQQCWEKEFVKTYRGMTDLMAMVELQEGQKPLRVPRSWAEHCIRADRVLDLIQQGYSSYEKDLYWREKLRETRRLVSDQLAGVAEVMGNLAGDIRREAKAMTAQEEQIHQALEELGLSIQRVEVINLEEGKVEIEVTLPHADALDECRKLIAPLLTEIVGEPIAVHRKMVRGQASGAVVTLGSAQRYEVKTGVAGTAKGGHWLSGDSYCYMNLGTGKYSDAVSDGMGNGERAQQESQAALQLLRQLLQSGIREDQAVETVNAILSLRSTDEMFATIDLAMVDLNTAHARFLKIGSTPGFIKRGKEVMTVSAANPPIGILREIDVEPVEEQLRPGDLLIMVTDGIYDAPRHTADKERWMKRLIAEIDTRDPQGFADCLLEKVIRYHDGEIADDMTVVVAKVEKHSPEWATIRLPGMERIRRSEVAGF